MNESQANQATSDQPDSDWLALVYEELRKLAAVRLAGERPGQTLQPTALVHEVFLRLLPHDGKAPRWDGAGHYFAAAAEAMRRILIERARRRDRAKHGGGRIRQPLLPDDAVADEVRDDILGVDEALQKLARDFPAHAELVRLRYYAGLSIDQAAAAMAISRTTAKRYWAFARAWLLDELTTGDPDRPIGSARG